MYKLTDSKIPVKAKKKHEEIATKIYHNQMLKQWRENTLKLHSKSEWEYFTHSK